jgi:NADPH:quinone reductase-like Zn-dependent oxidoreductase
MRMEIGEREREREVGFDGSGVVCKLKGSVAMKEKVQRVCATESRAYGERGDFKNCHDSLHF